MTILLLCCFVLIFLSLCQKNSQTDWRFIFIKSTLLWASILAFGTLLLNFTVGIYFQSVLVFWLIINACLLIYRLQNFSKFALPSFSFEKFTWFDKLLLFGIVIICIATCFIGLRVFPNNWDSMVYHLARVSNWIQFQSINYYATNSLSCVYQNPFAEYVILHLIILSKGNYYLSNLVQWFAFVNSIIAISYIVKMLDGRLSVQVFAAFLLATLPMAILQSTTTQNDVVAMLFLLFTVVFIYQLKINFHSYITHAFLGLAVGLAVLAKGTSFIYLFPFAVFYALIFFKHVGLKALQLGGVTLLLIVSINVNHWKNNYQTFGKPLSPNYGYLINDNFVRCFACNALKNATLQLQIPSIDKQPVNKVTTQLISTFDLERENCKWVASPNLDFVSFRFNEDYMANPFHFILFLLSLCIYLIQPKKNWNKTAYVFCILGIAFTFNFALTWQVWHPRLHLPILGLTCAFTAIIIQSKSFKWLLALLLFALASIVILKNELKPIIPKNTLNLTETEQLFIVRKELKPAFDDIIPLIKPYKNIALLNTGASWEFPFWYFLNRDYTKQIQSILVDNETQRYIKKDFVPEVVISPKSKYNNSIDLSYKNKIYVRKYNKNGLAVFIKR